MCSFLFVVFYLLCSSLSQVIFLVVFCGQVSWFVLISRGPARLGPGVFSNITGRVSRFPSLAGWVGSGRVGSIGFPISRVDSVSGHDISTWYGSG